MELHRMFAGRGVQAGCTCTVVLQVGWLLTSANLGDSRAVVDTGYDPMTLTVDHRIADHKVGDNACQAEQSQPATPQSAQTCSHLACS